MTIAKYGKLTAGLIVAWFLVSLTISALHGFNTDPGRPPLPLGLAVVIPVGLFVLWYAASKEFRQFVLGLNPRTLTFVHSWRLVGFTFLVLYSYGILPGLFALPAGWGDIVIGATAPFAAMILANPAHRRSFVFWQAPGGSGPGGGRSDGHDGAADRAAWDFHRRHVVVADESHSDVRRSTTTDSAYHLHYSGC
jgi:hypothetical protein